MSLEVSLTAASNVQDSAFIGTQHTHPNTFSLMLVGTIAGCPHSHTLVYYSSLLPESIIVYHLPAACWLSVLV